MLLVSRRGSFVLALVAGRVLPSLRCRLELRSSLMAAVHGRDDPMHTINRVLWRNWTKNSGANLSAVDSRATGAADSRGRAAEPRRRVSRRSGQCIWQSNDFLQLTAERNIPVFWLLTPLSPDLQAIRDQTGAEACHEQFIRSLQARFRSGMTVLDARRAGYPPELFADPTHLNRRGAVALSHVVSQEIKRLARAPKPAGPSSDGLDQLKLARRFFIRSEHRC